jgi:hypothetical protein
MEGKINDANATVLACYFSTAYIKWTRKEIGIRCVDPTEFWFR